jgi:DNA repair protein SbcC/Rad50
LTTALSSANVDAERAMTAFNAINTDIQRLQAERLTLLDGKPHRQVEIELNNAIDIAQASLVEKTDLAATHAALQIRCSEALVHANHQLQSLTAQETSAIAQLDAWLAQFNQRFPGAITINPEELRALLSHPSEWLHSEREQLHTLAQAISNANTVLEERRNQQARHEQLRPATILEQEMEENAGAIQHALNTLNAEQRHVNEKAIQLQLQIAEDDARRKKSSAMLADIEQQETVSQRWAKLNELIGSADGKKFRNYAQQFTLDVLLGYANRHLHELSRRYRLERINDTLALMVLDQEMGDEMRSVHSLSGGESFLVSLALALGLASLSSNRVRVESLFIDEGFGSLDTESLRVVMDALDGLQAMGRKVGVISHVQEMTERIGAKILIQRMTGGKSLVLTN